MTKRKSRKKTDPDTSLFGTSYPHIAMWVSDGGWVEIGYETYTDSFVRALDTGGMIWEGQTEYENMDQALGALDRGIAEWMEENW